MQSGAATWRCRECHGWDYLGAAGAYASGPRFTGIKGIAGMAGKDPAEIVRIIRGDVHRYTPDILPDAAVEKLALFVSLGQIDMDKAIDRTTGKAAGDPGRGVQLYRMACYACHGPDGRRINLGNETTPSFLGTVANDNPWATLHRIRNGLPDVGMPALALSSMTVEDQVDLLAYLQRLRTQ